MDKAFSTQSDVRTLLKKSSTIIFDEAKQRELNQVIMNHLVVHNELQLSRFNSAGFRRSFEFKLVSERIFKLVAVLVSMPGGSLERSASTEIHSNEQPRTNPVVSARARQRVGARSREIRPKGIYDLRH